ncbi:MAG: ATP-binding cassette domain-containing protein [Pseudomonadales bacterium]|nr:ATP-binding cassette domain-containing protein [Pseudomonadales bacterium]
MSRALRARGLSLQLGGRPVLNGISSSFEAGTCTAVVGPTGAGKSSLLALLAGDLAPSKGRVRMNGSAPHRMAPADLAGRRAVLAQRNPLNHPFSVDRVVELGFPGAPRALRRLVLAELGIESLAERIYTELSGGEQRLVHFARVLLQCETLAPPGWLFLDEPESHLDLGVVQRAMRAARRRAERGLGVIAAIHDLELASRWADRVLMLSEGAVAADGAPRETLTGGLLSELWRTPIAVDADDGTQGVRIRVLEDASSPRREPPEEDAGSQSSGSTGP